MESEVGSNWEAIIKLINDTPEGEVVFVMNSPENSEDVVASKMSLDEFFQLSKDPSRFFIISTTIRCGWAYFMRHLELKHFPPMSALNNLLINFDFKWKDMPFSCVAVPKAFHAKIVDSLTATNMKPVYGGVPTTIEATGFVSMPICADNCITIENGENHIIYTNDADAASEWQKEQIQKLEAECGL